MCVLDILKNGLDILAENTTLFWCTQIERVYWQFIIIEHSGLENHRDSIICFMLYQIIISIPFTFSYNFVWVRLGWRQNASPVKYTIDDFMRKEFNHRKTP